MVNLINPGGGDPLCTLHPPAEGLYTVQCTVCTAGLRARGIMRYSVYVQNLIRYTTAMQGRAPLQHLTVLYGLNILKLNKGLRRIYSFSQQCF